MLQIRKIKPEDIGFVTEIASENGCTVGKLLSNIENFLICEDGNVKCGCGCLTMKKDKGYMSWVIVSKDHRRKQLGGAITKALLNIADLNGIDEVYAVGILGDFLMAMGFEKQSSRVVMDDIKEVLGDFNVTEYRRVFLKGYFKPCSKK